MGIYFDAGGSPYNAGAVTGYDTARSFSAQNLRLATLIQNDVLGAMDAGGWGIPNIGVTDDSQLGGPALSTAAANYGHLLLLGPADAGWFTSRARCRERSSNRSSLRTPIEGTLAASSSGQEVIASGLAQAIEQYVAPSPGTRALRHLTPRLPPRNFHWRTRAQVHGASVWQGSPRMWSWTDSWPPS